MPAPSGHSVPVAPGSGLEAVYERAPVPSPSPPPPVAVVNPSAPVVGSVVGVVSPQPPVATVVPPPAPTEDEMRAKAMIDASSPRAARSRSPPTSRRSPKRSASGGRGGVQGRGAPTRSRTSRRACRALRRRCSRFVCNPRVVSTPLSHVPSSRARGRAAGASSDGRGLLGHCSPCRRRGRTTCPRAARSPSRPFLPSCQPAVSTQAGGSGSGRARAAPQTAPPAPTTRRPRPPRAGRSAGSAAPAAAAAAQAATAASATSPSSTPPKQRPQSDARTHRHPAQRQPASKLCKTRRGRRRRPTRPWRRGRGPPAS